MNAPAGIQSVAERLVAATSSLSPGGVPAEVRLRCEDLLVDVGGLCVAARSSDYIRALVASVDGGGPCTAIGHAGSFRAEDAAMISGTAAHGEDFDDTFEGGPVHSGAVSSRQCSPRANGSSAMDRPRFLESPQAWKRCAG